MARLYNAGRTIRQIAKIYGVCYNTAYYHLKKSEVQFRPPTGGRKKMPHTFSVEIQLLRDWQPRSRPSRGDLNVDDPTPTMTKLFPGAAAIGTENMIVTIEGATRIQPSWAAIRAALAIEGQPFSDPRPGLIFLGKADIPTCIIHFPVMAGDRSLMFRGWHTLLLRTLP